MLERTEIEMARVRGLKILRSLIRLKHSLVADDELNERLPAFDRAFTDALQSGQLLDDRTLRELVEEVISVEDTTSP